MCELRWLVTEQKVRKPVYPDAYGSPMMDAIETTKVLQYRYQTASGVFSNWITVPVIYEV